MDLKRLEKHIKLCVKNLKSRKVRCCAGCPFEKDILAHYPHLKGLFEAKRRFK
jgi:hypothetical protein